MKKNTLFMDQYNQIEIPDWLYQISSGSIQRQKNLSILQETQEDDFLLGKTPKDLEFTWEEEE